VPKPDVILDSSYVTFAITGASVDSPDNPSLYQWLAKRLAGSS
jgi:hypothetical protein